MDKEKALNTLLSEGYSASVENSILMVLVPKDCTEKDVNDLQEKLRERFREMDYSASWGIAYAKGAASKNISEPSDEAIEDTEDIEDTDTAIEDTDTPSNEETPKVEGPSENEGNYEEFGTFGEFKL